MREESLVGRALWPLLLTGVVIFVVLNFARQPLAGGDGQALGSGRQVTLAVAGGEADGIAEAVARQAAGCWQSGGQPARVVTLHGGASAAVVDFLAQGGAAANLLVLTSSTLSDIVRDSSGAPSSERGERARQAARMLARAVPIALLGSEPLAVVARASSPLHTVGGLLARLHREPTRPLFGVADDTWLQDNLAALVQGSGLAGRLPYTVYDSSRGALVGLQAGEVDAALAPSSTLLGLHDGASLRELPWPSAEGQPPRAWVAIVAPGGLSAAVQSRLRARASTLCAGSAWSHTLAQEGLAASHLDPATLRGFVQAAERRTNQLQLVADRVVRSD